MKADLDPVLLLANMVSNREGPDDIRDIAISALLEVMVVCYELVAGLKRVFSLSYGRLDKVTVQVDFRWPSTGGLCCYTDGIEGFSQCFNVTEKFCELSSFMRLVHAVVGRNSDAYERWCICLSRPFVCARQVSQPRLDRLDSAA